ncbi:MAG: excinuclease ABC subunit UvrA, partial [Desulfococcaceae bacterium]
MKTKSIQIRNARQNNLKNLDIDIPLHQFTVITGPSGSGKSSLAFDTLYAEGQRRYVETFSPYARQFMDRMDRPQVDEIRAIPPAIAIDRKDPVRTSRSTVGTMTEITDYTKLLFHRLAVLHCKECGRPVVPETPGMIWERLRQEPDGTKVVITFPLSLEGFEMSEVKPYLQGMGLDRLWMDGRVRDLDDWTPGNSGDTPNVLVDRAVLKPDVRSRMIDSLEQAFRFGGGRVDLWLPPDGHLAFSGKLECAECGIAYRPPIPNLFSFNSPAGACDTCRGFGRNIGIDMELVIPDDRLSLKEGAIKPFGGAAENREEWKDLLKFCQKRKIPIGKPFRDLLPEHRNSIIEGRKGYYGINGFFKWLESRTYKMHVRVYLSRYRGYFPCDACNSTRFKEETLLYRLGGRTIAEVYALNVDAAAEFFEDLAVPETDEAGRLVLAEIHGRLRYLQDVGLGYLTLDRQSRTLSGGEVQRVALASALGASLVNTLYILDEPSIGLHSRDNRRLTRILQGLRDAGNTVVVVEHDPEIIRESDHMIDLGPEAGERGGEVMYAGPTGKVTDSLTGQYLRGERTIPTPPRRPVDKKGPWLTVNSASEHNLKGIDFAIPLDRFVCLTGVSGSGKSTLAEDVLYRAVQWAKGDQQGRPGAHEGLTGAKKIAGAVMVDQSPIGRTPRANLLTYTKAMDPVRKLLAETEAAKAMGFGPGHFSFNVAGGRCETCKGDGFEKVEMQFLSDVYITCPDCNGTRFKPEVMTVRFRGKSIGDILDMTVDEALAFFKKRPAVTTPLAPLAEVGLGYMRLGQPVNTLSGGEAQRLKLAKYLRARQREAPTLFIFDEPTTGLHFSDIETLLTALRRLTEAGHTVLVTEHNLDVIKTADWVIDLGPEGGDAGGEIVVEGPPEIIADCPESHTGQFLKPVLAGESHPPGPEAAFTGVESPELTMVAESAAGYGDYSEAIAVQGAREHNLKDLSAAIPRNQLVVFTGVSGSGKSTLAFDILYAEGQRRYLESLAPYVRQYMKILERPEVDKVSGLPPTVAIEQRISHASRRSTVATLTEIYHFLRLLFSKLGKQHCPGCGRPLETRTRSQIASAIHKRYGKRSARILAPKVFGRKGFHKDVFARALKRGFAEARVDGEIVPVVEGMALSRYHEHTISLVMGKLPDPDLDGLVDRALAEGDGSLIVLDAKGNEEIFSRHGLCPACGIGVGALDPRLFSFNSPQGACQKCDGLGAADEDGTVCPKCNGSRLRPEALAVKVGDLSIWDVVREPADAAIAALKNLTFDAHDAPVAEPILAELTTRMDLLLRLGLGYLSLSRSGDTLSGGEAQRVRLAAQLGSNLAGVCYILDEPTTGLDPRDNAILIDALKTLRDRGNSILVVEHDEETIRAADTLIDLGPGAGHLGGAVVATGSAADLMRHPDSVTGASLNGRPRRITTNGRITDDGPRIHVAGASTNNLKGIDVDFPLGGLVCVTGVSGSGKSSLLKETVYKGLRARLSREDGDGGGCRSIEGWERIDRVVEVDHAPIGRTPRSVPASYVGFLGEIRNLFAATQEARTRG